MKILILNWRDIKNPLGGGAELLTHEIAKRWVAWGNSVTLITAGFKGAKPEENIDGVVIKRFGRWWNIHIIAFFYYIFNLKNRPDIIIDEVHWFPFFAGVYAQKKTVLLVCEVANRLFFHVFPYPLAFFWRFLEKVYFALYRNAPVLAISPSTKKDLLKEGFKSNLITVIPMGLTVPKNIKKFPKEKELTLIYLSRLNKQKGIEDAIKALKLVKDQFPKVKLWVVGKGKLEYLEYLKSVIKELNLEKNIIFLGFVSNEEKFRLLSQAHILVAPSYHEGWGLIIPEAGIGGTPAVAYRVAGLQDLIEDRSSGILVKLNHVSLSEGIIQLYADKNYNKYCKNAENLARKYDWEKTAEISLEKIKQYSRQKNP